MPQQVNGALSAEATGAQGTRLLCCHHPSHAFCHGASCGLSDPRRPLKCPIFTGPGEAAVFLQKAHPRAGNEDEGVSGQAKSCSWGPVKGSCLGSLTYTSWDMINLQRSWGPGTSTLWLLNNLLLLG